MENLDYYDKLSLLCRGESKIYCFATTSDLIKIKTVYPINTIDLIDDENNIIDKRLFDYICYDVESGFHYLRYLGTSIFNGRIVQFFNRNQINVSEFEIAHD